jgi:hypothetical protein
MTVHFTGGADAVHHLIIPYAASRSPMGREALAQLNLPHLQRWLNMLTRVRTQADDPDHPSLDMPHERALGQALQLPDTDGAWPWAALSNETATDAPQAFFSPCHWQIGMDQVVMRHPAELQLTETESQALLAAMQPFFAEDGLTVRYMTPTQWHVQGELLRGLRSASMDRVIGMNLNPWLPKNDAAQAVRRLQSEMQMLLYNHPVNDARSAQRQLTVNSFWVHGAGVLIAPTHLHNPRLPSPHMALALREPALREDASRWLAAWHELDATVCAEWLSRAETQKVLLTLCSEHAAHTYTNPPLNLLQRAKRLLRPTSVLSTLQAL